MFQSIAVLGKYFGVANVGAAIACFFMYGIQSFALCYFGVSIVLIILSLLGIRMVSYDPDYYDNGEVSDDENV
jgi:hypothetical protein